MCSEKDKCPNLKAVHLDILHTDEMARQNAIDEIEDRLGMASGILQYAEGHDENKAFFSGINEHIKQAVRMLDRVR
jgi:hypothetical protein